MYLFALGNNVSNDMLPLMQPGTYQMAWYIYLTIFLSVPCGEIDKPSLV